MTLRTFVIFLLAAFMLGACKSSDEPPPDILKSQRQTLDKAKALQGQLQQDTEQQMKQVDDSEGK